MTAPLDADGPSPGDGDGAPAKEPRTDVAASKLNDRDDSTTADPSHDLGAQAAHGAAASAAHEGGRLTAAGKVPASDLEALRAQLIREIVATAPALTGEVRERVRAILNPTRQPTLVLQQDKGARRPTAAVTADASPAA